MATVGGNAVFAAVTGVGVAAAAAFSHVAYPAMREARYSRSFATGCIAGSSVLGLLIPPSVFMIVWAILTEQSVGKLFAAGVFPGLLLALLYAVYCMVYAKLRPSAAPEMASDQQVRLTRGQIGGSLGVGVLIAVTLGGIWFGYFTPTEGSAVGLVGSAILAWAKGMRGRGVFNAFVEAGRTVTPIMLLLLTATIYSKLIALNGIPQPERSPPPARGAFPTPYQPFNPVPVGRAQKRAAWSGEWISASPGSTSPPWSSSACPASWPLPAASAPALPSSARLSSPAQPRFRMPIS